MTPSVLDRVREYLHSRCDIYVAGEIEGGGMGWVKTVAIIVAPQQPIYSIDELNKYMRSLEQQIKPTTVDEAYPYDDHGGIHLGRLYFDEVLGSQTEETKTTVTAHLPDALRQAGVPIDPSFKTRQTDLERRTWVRLYPDATVAQIVADYEIGVSEGTIKPDQTFECLEYWIDQEQLNKLNRKKNPFQRIAGLLK